MLTGARNNDCSCFCTLPRGLLGFSLLLVCVVRVVRVWAKGRRERAEEVTDKGKWSGSASCGLNS